MSTTSSTTTSAVNATGLLGQYEAVANATKATGNSALGKDDFLKLLVTQLEKQDPLNPTDDKEFVAQLAQFSSLEQLTNISTGITTLNTSVNQQSTLGAVGLLGKSVKAMGTTLVKSGDSVNTAYYTISQPVTSVQINIMDSGGNIIRSDSLGSKAAGDYSYAWDGLDYNGNAASDGNYTISITAVNSAGTGFNVTPQVSGTISGMDSSSGTLLLTTSDGRKLSLADITQVNNS